MAKNTKEYELVNYERIEDLIGALIQQYPHITQIVIGTPSIAQFGIIKYCDIPELEGVSMKEKLESKFAVPVSMENGFFRIITYSPEFLCRTVHQFCGQ